MITSFIALLVLSLALLLTYAWTRPDSFRISRSLDINAPASVIFSKINELAQWRHWSPWENIDPDMKRQHSGPESGVGAIYEWDGNKQVGQGRMEIVEVDNDRRVKIKLDFIRPFEAHNTAELMIDDGGNQNLVTWSMYGANNFFMKLFTIFISMDKMVGKDFETGLNNLKSVCESR